MPSKKPASSKRASLPLAADFTNEFLKDWKRLSHSGRFDMNRLKSVTIQLIADDEPLPPERRDHELAGSWSDHRECHIGGDFLLIYRVSGNSPKRGVVFVRAGTHADLFE